MTWTASAGRNSFGERRPCMAVAMRIRVLMQLSKDMMGLLHEMNDDGLTCFGKKSFLRF